MVAVLLPVLGLLGAVVLLVLLAVTRQRLLLAGVASWVLFTAVAVSLPWLPSSTGTPRGAVTVAVANVLTDNAEPAAAAADILAIDAEVVVVPEDNPEVHRHLVDEFPHVYGDTDERVWVGVYSRVPSVELPSDDQRVRGVRHTRVRIDGPQPFVLWALHLPRPWFTTNGAAQMRPRGHARTVDDVLEVIDAEDLPVVVAGDLNLTDRGRGYRRMTSDLDDAMRSLEGGRTSLKPLFRPLLLRIDHILEPPDWCADEARRFRISGSDHRGVAARIGPCASG